MKEILFPYTVKEKYSELKDGRCCNEIWEGFHNYRCSRKAKKVIDGIGFCGIHSKMIERWRKF